jgi:hypothetical protein
MFEYRITKYNPLFRDSRGAYTKDDWTSVSDFSDDYGTSKFNDYLKVENAYLYAIESIANLNKVRGFNLCRIEKPIEKHNLNDFHDIDTSDSIKIIDAMKPVHKYPLSETLKVSQLCLREQTWCKIYSRKMFVHFGYDYYMYIGSKANIQPLIKSITDRGLFVEVMKSPYK